MTGLLVPTEGTSKLFGKPMEADDMQARFNVGYMSQAFSLYTELTVRQNLELHAHLYHLPANQIDRRVEELLEQYHLKDVADQFPPSLPLGVKQRLQLAVAVLHHPAMLILDEPTSGVDLVGPIVMIVIAYGVSLDVENVRFAAFDQDRTKESRDVIDAFSSNPRWFVEIPPPISSSDELEHRFRSSDVTVAVEIPPRYGRDLMAGRSPEIGVWIDGAMPFRAETVRRYVQTLAAANLLWPEPSDTGVENPVNFETRLRYNQSFESIVAEVPNTIMLVLILVPAVMAAVGVVKEKETGSIANFYSTPITKFEFLSRNGEAKPFIGHGIFRIAAVDLITGETGAIAEIFPATPAIHALPACPAEPWHAYTIADFDIHDL